MVEWTDGSTLAQFRGTTDMRIMIQYALTYPRRLSTPVPRLDLMESRALHFEPADFEKFPCLSLAYTAADVGGTLPVVLSSADEVCRGGRFLTLTSGLWIYRLSSEM